MARHQCLNCGSAGVRAYCPECGQRHVPADLLDLRHVWFDYVEEAFRELKPVHTLWGLIRRPGQLTVDYVEGRRKRQANPLLLYVFFVGLAVTLIEYQDHSGQAEALVGPLLGLAGALQAGSDSGIDVASVLASWQDRLVGLISVADVATIYLLTPLVVIVEATVVRLLLGRDALRAVVTQMHVAVFAGLVSAPMLLLVVLFTSGELQMQALIGVYLMTELAWIVYGVAAVRRVYEVSWARSVGVVVLAGLLSRTASAVAQVAVSTVIGLILGVGVGLYLVMTS